MSLNETSKFVIYLLALLGIIIVLGWFFVIDAPKSSTLTAEERNSQIFSIGTLEDNSNIVDDIMSINLRFSGIEKTQTHADININMKRQSPFDNITFIFILPANSEIYYPTGLEVINRSYATVVYYPVSTSETLAVEWVQLNFVYSSFSKNIGYSKWAFNIDYRPFHFLFDNDGKTFNPLDFTAISSTTSLPRIHTTISFDGEDYSLLDFHPGTEQHFENSIQWTEYELLFSSKMSGTYESKEDRFILQIEPILFLFAGAVLSLIIEKIRKNKIPKNFSEKIVRRFKSNSSETTLVLKVNTVKKEDIKNLIARVSMGNLLKIYGKHLKYDCGTAVEIENNGKRIFAVLRDPISSQQKITDNEIKIDGWMRRRLNVKINDCVTVKKTRRARFMLFWSTMILSHPDINQRWENFGLFLAFTVLVIDLFIQIASWNIGILTQTLVIAVILTLIVLLPPRALIPKE